MCVRVLSRHAFIDPVFALKLRWYFLAGEHGQVALIASWLAQPATRFDPLYSSFNLCLLKKKKKFFLDKGPSVTAILAAKTTLQNLCHAGF